MVEEILTLKKVEERARQVEGIADV